MCGLSLGLKLNKRKTVGHVIIRSELPVPPEIISGFCKPGTNLMHDPRTSSAVSGYYRLG